MSNDPHLLWRGRPFAGHLCEMAPRLGGAGGGVRVSCNREMWEGSSRGLAGFRQPVPSRGFVDRPAVTNDAGPGAAFTVTLPAGDAGIFPTAYTLKHGNAGTQYSLRNWVLEAGRGGTDRNTVAEADWVLLSEHLGDGSLDRGFAHHTWPLAGHRLDAGNAVCGPHTFASDAAAVDADGRYTRFRVRMTGPNSWGEGIHSLCCAGFELFGYRCPRFWTVDSHRSQPAGVKAVVLAVLHVLNRARHQTAVDDGLERSRQGGGDVAVVGGDGNADTGLTKVLGSVPVELSVLILRHLRPCDGRR